MIQTFCPLCQTAYKLPDDQQGKRVRCKSCKGAFVVEAPEEAPVLEEATEEDLRTSLRKDTRVEELPVPEEVVEAPRKSAPAPSRRRREEDEDRPVRRERDEDRSSRRQRDRFEEDEPAERGSGGAGLLIGGACLAVLLLLGGGGALAYFFSRSPSSDAAAQTGSPPGPAGDPGAGNPFGPPPDQPKTNPGPPVDPPPFVPPPEKKITNVTEALAGLKDEKVDRRREALRFLARAPVAESQRDEVGKAIGPLLDDRDLRDSAVPVAGHWQSKENLAKLIDLLQAPGAPQWAQLIDALAQYKQDEAYEAIARNMTVFGHGNHARQALQKIGKDAEKAVVKYVHHESVFVRNDVAFLLERYKTSDAVRRDQAVLDLEGKPESVEFALLTLSKIPPDKESQNRVSAALALLLTNRDRNVRRNAMKSLEQWGTADSAPSLIEALADNDLRAQAVKLLGKFKDERAIKPLALLLGSAPRERAAIVEILLEHGAKAEKAVQVQLTNTDPKMRLLACQLLARLGTRDSLPILLQLAKADRLNAAAALAARKEIVARKKEKPKDR